MANFPNFVEVPSRVYDAAALTVPVDIPNSTNLARRFYAQPFNVAGFADTRPREGQLWPRGDGQSYGA